MINTILVTALIGQSRLPSMPGSRDFAEAHNAGHGIYDPPRLGGWRDETHFAFTQSAKTFIFDARTLKVTQAAPGLAYPKPSQNPARGRQFTTVSTLDGKITAQYVDGNIKLTRAGRPDEWVTTDGSPSKRIKYGTASWVYGEELEQRDAMGFSPNGQYIWLYRFNESKVLDYTLTVGMAAYQNQPYVEAYPKPGQPNPEVDLLVYNLEAKKLVKVPVRPGGFDDNMGHYVFAVNWDTDSNTLYFTRENRIQNQMDFCAYDVHRGHLRVAYTESNPTGWLESFPIRLTDRLGKATGRRFGSEVLFHSESTGAINYDWLNLQSGVVTPLTQSTEDVVAIKTISTDHLGCSYIAYGKDDPYHRQLFAGKPGEAIQITERGFDHEIEISPDKKYVIDLRQNSHEPPSLQLLDAQGNLLRKFAETKGVRELESNGFVPDLKLPFMAADNKTPLVATVSFPRKFDSARRYPSLLDVYGGPLPPDWGAPVDHFRIGPSLADYGFITINIDGRGTAGRGRQFRQAIFHQLGRVEIDDQAAGIAAMRRVSGFDPARVGVFGTSYGGYASAMLLLKYPNLFKAACSSSMVSDWRNYDTTYTERYMGLLPAQAKSYHDSALATYAKNLSGYLMIYYGTEDDNTHPSNSFQLIQALQQASKSFEVQVGVDAGHSGIDQSRMMEFFIERIKGLE